MIITSTGIFYKNSSVSLDCINELCSAIDSIVATIRENFTSKHQIETLNLAGCNI